MSAGTSYLASHSGFAMTLRRCLFVALTVLLATGPIEFARGHGVENNIEVLNVVDNSADCLTFERRETGTNHIFHVTNKCEQAVVIHTENCEPIECFAEPVAVSSELDPNYSESPRSGKFWTWSLGLEALEPHQEFSVDLEIHTWGEREDMGVVKVEGRYHPEPPVEGSGGCGGCFG